MLNLLKIFLEQPEYSALIQLAEWELRTPAEQARHLVRLELIRLGLLTENKKMAPSPTKRGISNE
jgi:hypothetical protein